MTRCKCNMYRSDIAMHQYLNASAAADLTFFLWERGRPPLLPRTPSASSPWCSQSGGRSAGTAAAESQIWKSRTPLEEERISEVKDQWSKTTRHTFSLVIPKVSFKIPKNGSLNVQRVWSLTQPLSPIRLGRVRLLKPDILHTLSHKYI